jgi:hypothetical protein
MILDIVEIIIPFARKISAGCLERKMVQFQNRRVVGILITPDFQHGEFSLDLVTNVINFSIKEAGFIEQFDCG